MCPASPEPTSPSGTPLLARAPWRLIAIIALAGVALRGLLLWLVLPLDIQSDEANYLYLALANERFGIYLDQHRYYWPPGYTWLMTKSIHAFGIDGLNVLRAFQVSLSSVIGVTTMLFAWRLFSTRAAVVAGVLWAVNLPLGAFTHLLWTETIFLALLLPALWHLLAALDRADAGEDREATRRLLLCGALFGLALYIKEYVLFLVPVLGVVIAVRSRDTGLAESLRRASLPILTVAVVSLPWTLRNHEVYGRTVIGGATLGENVFIGLNARSMNFDVLPLRKRRADLELPQIETLARASFTEVPAGWDPIDRDGNGAIEVRDAGWDRESEAIHAIDRHSAQLRQGLSFAAEHPAWTVRTRLKKWSELVTPLSFFSRHQAMAMYPEGGAVAGVLRGPLVLLALLMSSLTMTLGAAGFFLTLRGGPGRTVFSVLIGYVALTSLLVAMSRFRVPLEPILITLTAGFLAHGLQVRSRPRLAGLAATLLVLCGLWWISWPETVAAAQMALGVTP
ncbi:MAG: glycosyltransferase family 39 protein [Planctomycetota bacterium]|nr:glycosyltransferase family 39 protein [Planctomycetota bacterium]